MPLEKRPLHLGDGVVPVRGVFLEERFVAQQAADPAAEDDAGPVAERAPEGQPGGGGRVGVAAVLDLRGMGVRGGVFFKKK